MTLRSWIIQLLAGEKSAINTVEDGLKYGAAVGDGMNITRQLGNLPANICTPSYLRTKQSA